MANVLRAEDVLGNEVNTASVVNTSNSIEVTKKKRNKNKRKRKANNSDDSSGDSDDNYVPVRGRIVSGRVWKAPRKRFNSIIKTPGIRRSFPEKQALRQELKRVKEMSRAMEKERVDAKLAKKKRREENLRRAEENKKKNEVVQVIKNSKKIKKMKKSQLRKIEKRDTTQIS